MAERISATFFSPEADCVATGVGVETGMESVEYKGDEGRMKPGLELVFTAPDGSEYRLQFKLHDARFFIAAVSAKGDELQAISDEIDKEPSKIPYRRQPGT